MKILLRTLAVLFVAIGLFLLAAVINALFSDEGAREGVAVAYVAASILLGYLAVWMWRRSSAGPSAPAAQAPAQPPPSEAPPAEQPADAPPAEQPPAPPPPQQPPPPGGGPPPTA